MISSSFAVWGLLVSLVAAGPVAPSPGSSLQAVVLKHGGAFNPRPTAWRRLLSELEKRTSIATEREVLQLAATDPKLQTLPLVVWTGEGAMPPLSEPEVLMLRRFVRAGGLIFVDCVDEVFEADVRRELARVLPNEKLSVVPDTHVLWKSFYLVSSRAGRIVRRAYMEAIAQEERLAVVLSPNDHAGAWARDDFGRDEFEVSPGGLAQREMAVRFGVNLVMYALCLDYKDDQVHIPFIMRRRK